MMMCREKRDASQRQTNDFFDLSARGGELMEKELETMENTTHTISSFCHKNELSSDPAENDKNSLPFAEIRDRIDVVVLK